MSDDKNLMEKKKREEEDFREKVDANPELKQRYGQAWDGVAEAIDKAKPRIKEQYFRSTDSQLAGLAVNLVTYVAEIQKPDGERLEGFHDSQLESLRLRLFSPAPIYPEMEIARMTSALEAGVKELGPNDPWIKAVLDGRTPKDAANQMISGTKMGDAAFRKSLAEGGQAAVDASTDPLIAMARRMLARVARELQKGVEPPALDPASQRVRAASVLLDHGVKAEEWAREALGSLTTPVFSV